MDDFCLESVLEELEEVTHTLKRTVEILAKTEYDLRVTYGRKKRGPIKDVPRTESIID